MAQQISAGTPSGEYCVVDNGPAPAASVLDFSKAPIGYDNTSGSVAQDANAISSSGNSTVADWRNKSAAKTVLNSRTSTRLLWCNPA